MAEITASAFAMAGTPALLGRYLLPADESESAAPVVVIGHDAWQLRFGGDPNVVGRAIGLGGVRRTVVGVMPRGFRFPYDHELWVPLRENPLTYARGDGPRLYMFGRLASGVSFARAQAEFASVGQRATDAGTESDRRLRPAVVPYTRGLLDATMLWVLRAGQILVAA